MAKTEVGKRFIQLFHRFLTKCLCIDGLAAYLASDEIQGDYRVPTVFQQVPELDGLLGTDPPAISAPGAKRHVVQQFAGVPLILIGKGACRAVFNTRQAPVASAVYLKVCHVHLIFPKLSVFFRRDVLRS